MKISVCIPVYNGSTTIGQLVSEIQKELEEFHIEIILVNDGSIDESEMICEKIARESKYVKFISLRRNFGEHNAIMCALNYVSGDYAVIIDDDFQNPPQEIVKLITEARKGYDVVYSQYKIKVHHPFRNLGSKFNNLMATWLLNKPHNLYLSSFKVINRPVINEIIKYCGPFPYIDGLILRITNNFSSVYVDHYERKNGKSNYTIGKLISLWLNMFINFSIKPLRVITLFGLIVSFTSFVMTVWLIIEHIFTTNNPRGWTSIAVAVLFFAGVQLIFLGLLGEYIGKQYLDINKTPQWIVKKEIL
jgi:polyisoprenyl-phosphate glycosyltransferase